jgi:hypothetical protein
MLAVLRYGSGVPFYRLEGLQGSLNVPLPDSTQGQIVLDAVPAPAVVFSELIRQAAQGDEPCPMRNEPEGGAYFQRGMSLKGKS